MSSILDLIAVKRDGGALTDGQIESFIAHVMDENTPDYQIAAMLMTIRINGMDDDETAALTVAMARSGGVCDLSAIPGLKADKHSTGGVSDTTTLIAVPLAAACGVPVVKMSGRSLGHTGGTIDKLESIPGYRVDWDMEGAKDIAIRVGCALVGQSAELAPADKRLYALRDATATVDSIPLIASSILSKKFAAGADAIVLDVKCGSGALMPNMEDAKRLARLMVSIGRRAGKRVTALLTDMDAPLGMSIGNGVEVREAMDILKQPNGSRLERLSALIAAHMVALSLGVDIGEAQARVDGVLRSGAGYERFCDMVSAHGGDLSGLRDAAEVSAPVFAERGGWVASIKADDLGWNAKRLGAGRFTVDEAVDHAAGIMLRKTVGDFVERGDVLCELRHAAGRDTGGVAEAVHAAFTIADAPQSERPTVFGVITERDI